MLWINKGIQQGPYSQGAQRSTLMETDETPTVHAPTQCDCRGEDGAGSAVVLKVRPLEK